MPVPGYSSVVDEVDLNDCSPSRHYFTSHQYSIFINLVHNANISAAVHTDVAREQLLAAVTGYPHFGRLGVEATV